MSSYGRQASQTIFIERTQVLADGSDADWKTGGPTIDWSTITPAGTDTPLPDGEVIPAGIRFMQFGEVLARITASGKFGLHRTNAADGRQTLTPGDCFILNKTVREDEAASDHPGVFDGGRVWEARLVVGGTNQTTLALLKAAFPCLSYAKD